MGSHKQQAFDHFQRTVECGKLVATLQGQHSAQFSPHGESIVTTSEDRTARVWTVLPPSAGAPPPWFPDFLPYMTQQRLSDGDSNPSRRLGWLAVPDRLRKIVREIATQGTPYLRILRQFVHE
jgi:WD40 repeat protein